MIPTSRIASATRTIGYIIAEMVLVRTASTVFEYATKRRSTASRLPERSPAINDAV